MIENNEEEGVVLKMADRIGALFVLFPFLFP